MSVLPSDPLHPPPGSRSPAPSAALAKIKPRFNGAHPEWASLRTDLLQLSASAELLSSHRPRSRKNEEWTRRMDELDREGQL